MKKFFHYFPYFIPIYGLFHIRTNPYKGDNPWFAKIYVFWHFITSVPSIVIVAAILL